MTLPGTTHRQTVHQPVRQSDHQSTRQSNETETGTGTSAAPAAGNAAAPAAGNAAPSGTARTVRRPIAAVLAAAGGLSLAAFPLLRPWGDKTGAAADMVEAFASPMWVVSHSAGMLGCVLLAAAALLAAPRARRWIAAGVALILPFFGAETFGLHAVAGHAGGAAAAEVEALAALIREGTAQMTMFGIGLLAIAIGGVLLALPVRRNRAAILLAIALVTYLPQFFFGPEIRIAHGLLLLTGALWWAWSLARANAGASESDAAHPAAAA